MEGGFVPRFLFCLVWWRCYVSLILMSSLLMFVLSTFKSSTVSQLTSLNIGKHSPLASLLQASSWRAHNKKLKSEIMKSYYWLQLKLQLQMFGTCVHVLPLTLFINGRRYVLLQEEGDHHFLILSFCCQIKPTSFRFWNDEASFLLIYLFIILL